MSLAEAYAVCRTTARREAKNFYYAFRVLPPHKRNAMCAVYAFMRRADDIADDETLPLAQRREVMSQWVEAWRTARQTGISNDPVFLAVNDTQKRFAIPDTLLEDLVRGTTMDLNDTQPGVISITEQGSPNQTFHIYETFDGLYRYCYLVASVVGLVCIRIFGYTDGHAEDLAEKTGVAFQLTNILRDVTEDAQRGRIYLPYEDLHKNHVTLEDLLSATHKQSKPPAVIALLEVEACRARGLYAAAQQLLPLIDRDSRAALWVMVTIYRGLLERIAARNYDVFTERISVPNPKKLLILAQGAAMSLRNRALP